MNSHMPPIMLKPFWVAGTVLFGYFTPWRYPSSMTSCEM